VGQRSLSVQINDNEIKKTDRCPRFSLQAFSMKNIRSVARKYQIKSSDATNPQPIGIANWGNERNIVIETAGKANIISVFSNHFNENEKCRKLLNLLNVRLC
jgi:signal recognition particle subunit SEC65